MRAWLVLGCDGHTDKDTGFCMCPSVENIILDLEKIRKTYHYLDFIRYLDRVPKLFNGVCAKPNLVTNAVYKAYEYGYMEERLYNFIGYFYKRHAHCGIILYIKPKD